MSCLGVLFSLDEKEVEKLKSYDADSERLEYLQHGIEEIYFEKFPDRIAELDKSWDGLHRSLTDGKYGFNNGEFPLNHVILGGEILYNGNDYIMTLKCPKEVQEIAKAVKNITKEVLKKGYEQISADDEDYADFISEEDFQYTWDWFSNSIAFWELAAKENRYVLFTADQ
ncbi:YfbM family protein [Sphingobacterium sp. UDSM-2020]|uniref:YfbM family protein n=1 Tax=Sphingobacterium sp. UDSM-2020 TaxID=2795738 RepID=UPI00193563DC|nr:YfbM family protein [Sphingobacterium sp. UDSM-2020]QQD12669.1 YfbM family protein [Sphingobacterium sp. UDSM-2020]